MGRADVSRAQQDLRDVRVCRYSSWWWSYERVVQGEACHAGHDDQSRAESVLFTTVRGAEGLGRGLAG